MKSESKEVSIKSWPADDRPREKLLKRGAAALSNSELLAILLRTGVAGESAVGLARRMLEKFGTFRNMSHTDPRDWREFKGVGPAKLAQIQAALEIGRRFREDEALSVRHKIACAADVVGFLMPQMRDLKTECFRVVYLNSNNRILAVEDAAKGTVNMALPIVREILHAALQKYAAALICVHNHPSANITPSPEDRKFTGELTAAGKLLGIRILDHIIIGDGGYYSFADEGLMP
ncbi:MAG: DNA repair protein RadC [Smithellaceae bacterium]|nr:DNA repair protein RadC [Syntrophaceae bacterium]MDD4241986.1 DNA repair protein RadC [Smithellaceae bacterium]NLX50590.1 DNA repair protein RadC [Deltaproteobacteria bacterium]